MYEIGDFRVINKPQNYLITLHGQLRLRERCINIDDVIWAVNNAEIIEQYEDDYPLPSCLMLGKDATGRVIHIVASKDEETIYLITAYEPSLEKWMDGFKCRKRGD